MKIKTRLRLNIFNMLIPFLIVIFMFAYWTIRDQLFNQQIRDVIEQSIDVQRFMLNEFSSFEPGELTNPRLVALTLSNQYGYRTQIFDKKLNLLADTSPRKLARILEDVSLSRNGVKHYTINRADDSLVLFMTIPLYDDQETIRGFLRWHVSLDEEAEVLRNILVSFTLLFLAMMLTVLIISRFIANSFTKPIDELKHASARLAKGQHKFPLPKFYYEELNDLSRDFESMSKSISFHMKELEKKQKSQQTFIHQLTHELRTPVTAIVGYAQLLPRMNQEEDINLSLKYIEKESIRLNRLIDELLKSAKDGNSQFPVINTFHSLDEVIYSSFEMTSRQLQEKGIGVRFDLQNTYAYFDVERTEQVLLNIIQNVIKHSGANHLFCQSYFKNEDEVCVLIKDNGIGISLDKIEQYKSKNHIVSSDGNGYGLRLIHDLMHRQGGSAQLINGREGTIWELTFLTSRFSYEND